MVISLFLDYIRDIFIQFWTLFIQSWWLWLPIFLFFVLAQQWLNYIQKKFLSGIEWILLEIQLPQEVVRTPKAMENVFAGFHGIHTKPDFIDKWFNGKVQLWFSLEMASLEGKTHFFIRSPAFFRNLVEAQVYAQFPQAEINLVEDYTLNFPSELPRPDWDLWGTELILIKEDAYPIRTHVYFETGIEETQVDPLAALTEVFSRLGQGEQLWVQIIVRPTGDKWKKAGEKLVDKLIGRKTPLKYLMIKFLHFLHDTAVEFLGPIIGGGEVKREEKVPENLIQFLSPGQKEVVAAIEQNISKIGFETAIRFIYLGRPAVFNRANISAIIGVFKQFNTHNLNGFKANSKASTSGGHIFTKIREYLKKKKFFFSYKLRIMTANPFVFNIEELATVYHFPGKIAAAPMLPRIQAKKAEPPTTLPIE